MALSFQYARNQRRARGRSAGADGTRNALEEAAPTIGMGTMRRSKNPQPNKSTSNIVTLVRSNEARARGEVRQEERAKEGTKALMEY
jgi:hypothetical protein